MKNIQENIVFDAQLNHDQTETSFAQNSDSQTNDEIIQGNNQVKQKKRGCKDFKGLFYMLISALSFSIMSMLVNYLGHMQYSTSQLMFTRTSINTLLCISYIRYKGYNIIPTGGTRKLLVSRGFIGLFSMFGGWFMLTQLAMSDATVVIYTSPFFTMILAAIFINEPLVKIDAVIMFIGFSGVLLVARPKFLFGQYGSNDEEDKMKSGLPRILVITISIISSFAGAIVKILVRKLKHVPAIVTISYLMIFASIGSLTCLIAFPNSQKIFIPKDPIQIIAMVLMSSLGFFGQLFKTQGLKIEKAGPSSMMRLLDLILAPIWQTTILHQPLHTLTIIGSIIILITGIMIGLKKLYETNDNYHEFQEETLQTEPETEDIKEPESQDTTEAGTEDIKVSLQELVSIENNKNSLPLEKLQN